MAETEGSKKFKLNGSDVKELVKVSLLVGGAAALTYFVDNFAKLDLGTMAVVAVPIVTTALSAVIEWMKDKTKKEV